MDFSSRIFDSSRIKILLYKRKEVFACLSVLLELGSIKEREHTQLLQQNNYIL